LRPRIVGIVAASALVACVAPVPPAPSPGTATAWGFVRLVPREGVTPRRVGAPSPCEQPGTRSVEFVDYSKPGFVVVYLEGTASPAGTSTLRIRDGRMRPYLDPEHAAVGAGGTLRVENTSGAQHSLSMPGAGVLRSLGPGEALEIALREPGERSLFLLDVPEAEARLFVAPGRFAVAKPSGQWELRDVSPGRLRLSAWHPRFPASVRPLELGSGDVVRVDLELGVGTLGEAADGG
jgi:hypothetical protein